MKTTQPNQRHQLSGREYSQRMGEVGTSDRFSQQRSWYYYEGNEEPFETSEATDSFSALEANRNVMQVARSYSNEIASASLRLMKEEENNNY
jgi:hypothetical protein